MHRTLLYENLYFLANPRGQDDRATARSFRLMSAELDLSSSLTVLIDNITDGERGNLADPQTGIDGKHESESISLGVSSGLDDPEYASNIGFREN